MTGPRALCAALMLLGPALAAAGEKDHREHGAHEHGHGVLEIVAEGDELVIELRIPAVNVVGFEHEPSTDEQRHAVEEAIERFQHGEKLFAPVSAAKCKLEDAEVELAGMHSEHGDSHGHDKKHGHEKKAKSHEHEHEKGEKEAHDHAKGEKHDEEAHSELHAEYHFHCDDPKRLDAIQVRVFDALRDAEEIDARIVTATFQGAVELEPGDTTLKLTK